jgi:hypothetical protein
MSPVSPTVARVQLLIIERVEDANAGRYYVLSADPALLEEKARLCEHEGINRGNQRRVVPSARRSEVREALSVWLARKSRTGLNRTGFTDR